MSNILTFAVAPTAVLIASSVDQPTAYRAMTIVAAALFVTAAMLRLARHATDTAGHATSFAGCRYPPLPSPPWQSYTSSPDRFSPSSPPFSSPA